MSDAILVIQLIQDLANKIRNAAILRAQMESEGRSTLTDDERQQLGLADDAARQKLVDAINRAKNEGR